MRAKTRLKQFGFSAAVVLVIISGQAATAWADSTTTAGVNQTVNQSTQTGTATVEPSPPTDTPTITTDGSTDSTGSTDTSTTPDGQLSVPTDNDSTDITQPSTEGQQSDDQTPVACDTAPDSSNDQMPGTDTSTGSGGGTDTSVSGTTTVNNNLCATAQSGDATVSDTQNGGNATTGDAQSTATVLNLLQSVTGLSGSQLATFVKNIYGTQNGDIYIDPSQLSYALGTACGYACGGNDVSLNSDNSSAINNNIYLGANSGNASVSDNNGSSNATTGDAVTLLNLVNILNSLISSGHSFIGTVNIYGDLNGDILLPPDFVSGLISDGSSAVQPSGGNINLDSNLSINNHINMSAISGDALVVGQGNALSGDALTNLVSLNLINQQIIGKNILLVFVNVMGQWTGLIFNAPAGASSASLGGGLESSQICATCGAMTDINSHTSAQINNNVYLTSVSGNATVSGNRGAGNATSGDASASLNLVNIINSQLSLTNWFGILFINVFGKWQGSLEPAPVITTSASGGDKPGKSAKAKPQVFAYQARGGYSGFVLASSSSQDPVPQKPSAGPQVLGSSSASADTSPTIKDGSKITKDMLFSGLALIWGLLWAVGYHRRHSKSEQSN